MIKCQVDKVDDDKELVLLEDFGIQEINPTFFLTNFHFPASGSADLNLQIMCRSKADRAHQCMHMCVCVLLPRTPCLPALSTDVLSVASKWASTRMTVMFYLFSCPTRLPAPLVVVSDLADGHYLIRTKDLLYPD